MAFQYVRDRSIDGARDFFAEEFISVDGKFISKPSEKFKQEVLSKAKNQFEACLLWYHDMKVLSARDIAIALRLIDYRNMIAHEPARVLMGDQYKSWAYGRAFRLLRKVDSFWIQVAVETDEQFPNDYDRNEAKSIYEIMLHILDSSISYK